MANDDLPKYEAPRALRVGSAVAGTGDCMYPGSGDTTKCYDAGNTAAMACDIPGNSAAGSAGCASTGNSATGYCATGNGFTGGT